jgi:hypothetical protein
MKAVQVVVDSGFEEAEGKVGRFDLWTESHSRGRRAQLDQYFVVMGRLVIVCRSGLRQLKSGASSRSIND